MLSSLDSIVIKSHAEPNLPPHLCKQDSISAPVRLPNTWSISSNVAPFVSGRQKCTQTIPAARKVAKKMYVVEVGSQNDPAAGREHSVTAWEDFTEHSR
jgi:hypothetical protein